MDQPSAPSRFNIARHRVEARYPAMEAAPAKIELLHDPPGYEAYGGDPFL